MARSKEPQNRCTSSHTHTAQISNPPKLDWNLWKTILRMPTTACSCSRTSLSVGNNTADVAQTEPNILKHRPFIKRQRRNALKTLPRSDSLMTSTAFPKWWMNQQTPVQNIKNIACSNFIPAMRYALQSPKTIQPMGERGWANEKDWGGWSMGRVKSYGKRYG